MLVISSMTRWKSFKCRVITFICKLTITGPTIYFFYFIFFHFSLQDSTTLIIQSHIVRDSFPIIPLFSNRSVTPPPTPDKLRTFVFTSLSKTHFVKRFIRLDICVKVDHQYERTSIYHQHYLMKGSLKKKRIPFYKICILKVIYIV